MITAFRERDITFLIHHSETPVRKWDEVKKTNFKFLPTSDTLIEMHNILSGIQMVVPDEEGTGAQIINISYTELKRLSEIAEAILKELPPPGNVSDYEDF